MQVVIIGSGMAALGAAHRLREAGIAPELYDKKPYPGGHTASFAHPSGFVFDDGPHVSFTKSERLQRLLADNVGGRFEEVACRVNNYYHGHWVKHPAQCNLYGLPADLVATVLEEFEALEDQPWPQIDNYEQWLVASYGETFARNFPMRYGHKYHTCEASQMTTDWLGPRLYRPSLEEVRYGATHPETPDVHYANLIRYPTEGGFYAYLEPWIERADLHLEHELVAVDPKARQLRFANGVVAGYDELISTVPLPALVPMIDGAPDDVLAAASRLACTHCVVVNLGIDREGVSDHLWTYFYDEDILFSRLSFPHLFSSRTAPPGTSAIQAECYYSDKYKPLDISGREVASRVEEDLVRCGLLRPDDRVLMREVRPVRWANIIFDHDRPAALATVHGFLADVGIRWAGRYGEWGYHWTDQSFVSGESAASRALTRSLA